jgi:hypothetical protein
MRGFQNMSLEDRVAALEAQMAETLRLAGEARLPHLLLTTSPARSVPRWDDTAG